VKLSAALEVVHKHEDSTKTRCTPARTETASKFGAWNECNKQCAAAMQPAFAGTFRREITDTRAFLGRCSAPPIALRCVALRALQLIACLLVSHRGAANPK
jgi:hypothetical protein